MKTVFAWYKLKRHTFYLCHLRRLHNLGRITVISNDRRGGLNHRPFTCLSISSLRLTSKGRSKVRIIICGGKPPVTGGFPSQRTSYADSSSLWWHHHVCFVHQVQLLNDFHVLRPGDAYMRQPMRHQEMVCSPFGTKPRLTPYSRYVHWTVHYSDVIKSAMASQITSLTIVYSTVYSDADHTNIKAPRHWPLWGEFTGDRWIPAQRASNTENVSIWWRHHGVRF